MNILPGVNDLKFLPIRLGLWATAFLSVAFYGPLRAAEITLGNLVQEYDGMVKAPAIATDPPGLNVSLEFFPRSQAQEIYRRAPLIPQPSHPSYGLDGKSDLALGDVFNLGGNNRRLESVEAILVNWARASSFPGLAEANPEGYLHPLTLTVYRVIRDDLFLLAEITEEFLIPWRPETLDDGGEYPYGGLAYRARFDFLEEVNVDGKLAILISYNTSNGGREPLGVPGPYDSLNVALSDWAVEVGSDDDPTRMVRDLGNLVQSAAFGRLAPMFVVRAFPAEPDSGNPIDAGGYLVKATVDGGGIADERFENFKITPQLLELNLLGLHQSADGSPKTIEVAGIPEGSSAEVVFAKRDDLPVERGLYPFFVRLSGGNVSGFRSGVMRLGYSFESWASEKIAVSGERGRDDDPDGDGMGNFHEYLSASDPADAAEFRADLLTLNQEGEVPVLEFTRNNEATDMIYFLEESESLGPDAVWSALPVPPEGTNPFVDHEVITLPLNATAGAKRFFRLRCETVAAP
ncbi:MBG domain-containing protein [Akkermansiaceae bacterium]|nr:MBG domain-containing protein [Akkermansiaceae bacterium]